MKRRSPSRERMLLFGDNRRKPISYSLIRDEVQAYSKIHLLLDPKKYGRAGNTKDTEPISLIKGGRS